MEHSILPPARIQLRNTPISPRTSMLAARWPAASLVSLHKGDSVQGFVSEVRDASVQVKLMSGIYGWADGPSLGLDDDQHPCDWYREGDWVTAEVTGLNHRNDCVTLSIRSPQRQWLTPIATRLPDSPLDRLQRGSRLLASVQAVEKNGLRVVADGAPGWIDRRSADIVGKSVLADKYRAGQLITVWVTGVNHDGGEFHAQVNPLPSPSATSKWHELLP